MAAPSPTTAITPAEGESAGATTRPGRPTPFRPCVWLTKQEAFDACQALADADRVLVAAGTIYEARVLGDLFELLEDRMTRPAPVPAPPSEAPAPRRRMSRPRPGGSGTYDDSGSYSMESEFTQ